VNEPLQLGDRLAGMGLVVAARQPVGVEFPAGLVAQQDVVGRDEDRVRDCPGGTAIPRLAVRRACWMEGHVVPFIRPIELAALTSIAVSHVFPCRLPDGRRLRADSAAAPDHGLFQSIHHLQDGPPATQGV
jgi:hypothetical protein